MKHPLPTRSSSPRPLGLGSLLGLSLLIPMAVAFAQLAQDDAELSDSPYLRIDPDKIVLDDRDTRIPCGECHNLEYEVWTETKHATGFDELHRSDQAQAILDKMGFRRAKSESLCLKCHYTAKEEEDGDVEAIAGVSCESCHGAARDWVDVHQDYGGATRETETPEHREMRIQQSIANGMLRPSSNLYAVAANCFECHTVPEEELINVGGHPSGSAFDLVEWTGEIRHNFLPAQWGGSEENRQLTPERRRMMYVIGKALDYEYSIRGAARASQSGAYAKAMESRVKAARRELDKILRIVDISEVARVVRIGQEARIVPNNGDALIEVAEQISLQAQEFAREYDGTELAALDPLIRGEAVALGGDAEEQIADTGSPYEARTRPEWFPTLDVATIQPGGCSCHGPSDPVSGIDKLAWHENDAHSAAAEPLLTESARAVQIATAYGLSPEQMKQGNQLCMNCHGTIVTGNEAFEVDAGVSCQSCHGPAEEYQSNHQSGGYEQGEALGMTQLEEVSIRAATCARCHHITDERLLSAGHSTGGGFQMSRRNSRIRHWVEPSLSDGDLSVAYTAAINSRPIPEVELVAAASEPVEAPEPDGEPPDIQPDDPAESETTDEAPATAPERVSEPVAARVVGTSRRTPEWFPTFRQTTLAPLQNCGCHGDQLRWHSDDAHNFSAEPLIAESARAVRIAGNYGLSVSQMKQGNQICMSCHGSVETGAETAQVFDGVSCQSCHGPAGEYVNQHQSNGYEQGEPLGMIRLDQAAPRANNCARCHHITDERLLSAGHSDGSSFQMAARNEAIQHWDEQTASASALGSAYASAISSRPVPGVERAALPEPTASTRTRSTGGGTSGSPTALPRPPTPRPVSGFTPSGGGAVQLDSDAPAVTDTTSTEDILLIVKQRLENIYRALGRGE